MNQLLLNIKSQIDQLQDSYFAHAYSLKRETEGKKITEAKFAMRELSKQLHELDEYLKPSVIIGEREIVKVYNEKSEMVIQTSNYI